MKSMQIGEVAQRYCISRRSLRYWEEKGILESIRQENGYRMYDEENIHRIRQIIMLKKLELPIANIHNIFLLDNSTQIINILEDHLETIKRKSETFSALCLIIETLIHRLKTINPGKEFFALLDAIEENSFDALKEAFSSLSERKDTMENLKLDNEIRIVCLPKMTFACYSAESTSPENDCNQVMSKFILDNNIKEMEGFRHFGFNNPNPTEGSSVYGYEMWAVIPNEFDVPAPLWKKEFSGGLFASMVCTIADIGDRWQKLYSWTMESTKYEIDYLPGTDRVGLEETINYDDFNSPKTLPAEMQLDLLIPIKARK